MIVAGQLLTTCSRHEMFSVTSALLAEDEPRTSTAVSTTFCIYNNYYYFRVAIPIISFRVYVRDISPGIKIANDTSVKQTKLTVNGRFIPRTSAPINTTLVKIARKSMRE